LNFKSLILKILISILVAVFGIKYTVPLVLKKSIKENVFFDNQLHVDDISFNVWNNSLKFQGVSIKYNTLFSISSNKITLTNVNWFSVFFLDRISLSKISVLDPVITKLKQNTTKSKSTAGNNFQIKVGEVNVISGVYEDASKEQGSQINKFDISLYSFKFPATTNNIGLPFSYTNLKAVINDLSFCNDYFECTTLDKAVIDENYISINNFQIKTKYTKEKLSKIAKVQTDYLELNFPNIKINDFKLEQKNKNIHFSSEEISVANFELYFFRDKNLKENIKYKPLYSEALHKLSSTITFTLPKINFTNGKLIYEVLPKNQAKKGNINFNNINANLSLNNKHNKSSYLNFKGSAHFMKVSPVNLKINFDTLSNNQFFAEGSIKDFKTNYINTFLYNVLNTNLEGEAEETYFTISGNNSKATGAIKMKYDNLKVKFMKEKTFQVNNFLSSLGNLVINNGSETDAKGYRNGVIQLNRPKNKSFFSYLWLAIKDGILNTLTGKPEIK